MTTVNREDLGVFITLTLFGAGLGLVIGAFVEARMNDEDEYEQETYAETQSKTKAGSEETPGEDKVERKTKRDRVENRAGEKEQMETRKNQESSDSAAVLEELERFEALYDEVTPIQRELVLSGLLTITDLERQLQTHDHVDYTRAYVTQDDEVIEGGLVPEGEADDEIFSAERRSDSAIKYNKKYMWFAEDTMLMRVVGGGQLVLVSDPDEVLWPGVIEEALQASEDLQAATVYAFVEGTDTQYAISISDSQFPEYDGATTEPIRRSRSKQEGE